jgi:DNA polymerase-1
MSGNLLLVDGSGYIFRAYHALPALSRKSDGLPTGAVHGFCQMLWKLLRAHDESGTKPTHIAVIFDATRKNFRNDIYPHYKANRPEAPEDLIPQFPLVREAVEAFGIKALELEGFEADDIIATYVDKAKNRGMKITVVSSDKDLMQLVGHNVTMLDTMKNRTIGEAEVKQKFGVGPTRVVDVQALAGDSSDNVPGVPGIGIKTAAMLINEYGDLEALLQNSGEIKQQKRRENLQEFADLARISYQLVSLRHDVPMIMDLEDLQVGEISAPEKLLEFLGRMEFSTLSRRIANALGSDMPAVISPHSVSQADEDKGDEQKKTPADLATRAMADVLSQKIQTDEYQTIKHKNELASWLAQAREQGFVAFDVETNSLDAMQADLVGFSLALKPGKACYVPLAHRNADGFDFAAGTTGQQIAMEDALAALKNMLEDCAVLKIGQNIKYDTLVMRRYGINIAPFDDTMLLSYALDAGRGSHSMDELAERHLGHSPISFKQVAGSGKSEISFDLVAMPEATKYAAEDADITLRLWKILKPRLASEKITTVYETLERPLVEMLVDMEQAGIKINQAALAKLSGEFAENIHHLGNEIYALADKPFNIASPKQLGDILFGNMRLPGGKKTKTGAWSTRSGVLEDMATSEDIPADARKMVAMVLEWRQLAKLKSTYSDALPGFINSATGRVHTSYSMAGTTTGRLASSAPNLQNIPARTIQGRSIRAAFVAEKGCKLISADYSQIELRVLAHVANIGNLKQAFADNVDIHAMTASEMFHIPLANVDTEFRRRAKAINFGIIYGISAFGLANQLGISRTEASDYIDTYFNRFPGIRDYMEEIKRKVHADKYVETAFGRRIYFPEAGSKNPQRRSFVERAAINAPIQGTAADIIRRAMIRMPEALQTAGVKARMLLQVHDELIFEAAEEDVATTMTTAVKVMENACEPAVSLSVLLQVDAHAAENWEAAH